MDPFQAPQQPIHSVFSIPAHPFGGLVLQVFFGQFGLVYAGIWLLNQNFEGLSCWYIFWAGELSIKTLKASGFFGFFRRFRRLTRQNSELGKDSG